MFADGNYYLFMCPDAWVKCIYSKLKIINIFAKIAIWEAVILPAGHFVYVNAKDFALRDTALQRTFQLACRHVETVQHSFPGSSLLNRLSLRSFRHSGMEKHPENAHPIDARIFRQRLAMGFCLQPC